VVIRAGVALVVVIALVVAAAAPAGAAIRPLSARADKGAGPAIAGTDVVFSRKSGKRSIVLRAVPGTRGPARAAGRVTAQGSGRVVEWTVGGGPAGLAVRLATSDRARNSLFAGPAGGPFRALTPPSAFGGEPGDIGGPASPVPGGVLTEGSRRSNFAIRTPGGGVRAVRLPAGAEPALAGASGTALAVPVLAERAVLRSVAIVDLGSGVTRTIAAGRLTNSFPSGVGIGPDGSVALSATGVVGYAAPGATTLTVIPGRRFPEFLAPAGGRIAMVDDDDGAGERVTVIRPGSGSARPVTEYRGPVAADIDTLAFDGARAAWGTEGCQVASDTDAASSAVVLPRGPCVRTETEARPDRLPRVRRDRRGYYLRLRVTCLATPARTCRVRVRARDVRERSLGAGSDRIRLGRTASVRVPLRGRNVRRARRSDGDSYFELRSIDPDGRSRTELASSP
jgi:hypothetical protein